MGQEKQNKEEKIDNFLSGDKQEKKEEKDQKPKCSCGSKLGVVLAILLTAVLVGSGVYYLMEKEVRGMEAKALVQLENERNISGKYKEEKAVCEKEKEEIKQAKETRTPLLTIIAKGGSYKSEKYNFEFMSPHNLLITPSSTEDNIILSDTPSGHWTYNIQISNNTTNLSLEEAFEERLGGNVSNNQMDISQIDIDGKIAKKFSKSNYTDYGNSGIVLVYDENIISIFGDDSSEQNKLNFDAFINSFKFAK